MCLTVSGISINAIYSEGRWVLQIKEDWSAGSLSLHGYLTWLSVEKRFLSDEGVSEIHYC